MNPAPRSNHTPGKKTLDCEVCGATIASESWHTWEALGKWVKVTLVAKDQRDHVFNICPRCSIRVTTLARTLSVDEALEAIQAMKESEHADEDSLD